MRASLIVIVMMLFFGGCSQTTPAMKLYTIPQTKPQNVVNALGCKNKTLKLQKVFTTTDLLVPSMFYRVGKFEQLSYTESAWSLAPSEMVLDNMHGMLVNSGLFKSVELYKSKSKNDLDLEIGLEEFMQYFDADLTTSHAMVKLRLTLLDATTHEVVATKLFSKEIAADENSALGGVAALSDALDGVMDESLEFFGEICR
jgi:ABC-type uncharacterized transport system auxiliary subunit